MKACAAMVRAAETWYVQQGDVKCSREVASAAVASRMASEVVSREVASAAVASRMASEVVSREVASAAGRW